MPSVLSKETFEESLIALNPSNLPADTLIGIGVFIALFVLFLFWGKENAVRLQLATLLGLALTLSLPTSELSFIESFRVAYGSYTALCMYLAATLFSFLILKNIVTVGESFSRPRKLLEIGLLAATLGLSLIAIGYKLEILPGLYSFSKSIAQVFASSFYLFVWLVVEIVILYLVSSSHPR